MLDLIEVAFQKRRKNGGMYLKKVHIEHNGAIDKLTLSLPFDAVGKPKPLIVVGKNGSGKSNFLSIIADALFEAASSGFDGVLTTQGNKKSWFRVAGGSIITIGKTYNLSVLKFCDENSDFYFTESAGAIDIPALQGKLNDGMDGAIAGLTSEQPQKNFSITDEKARTIFNTGAYAFFPPSRSEIPYWLNSRSILNAEFEVTEKFSTQLYNPIFVEHGLYQFKQWLLSLITDVRIDANLIMDDGKIGINAVPSAIQAQMSKRNWQICNVLIQTILDNSDARFVWLGRTHPQKLGVQIGSSSIIESLNNLSSGEVTLLCVFGNLLRYLDKGGAIDPAESTGIWIIDEIDAHIHIGLLQEQLPKLMKLFPRVQFIVSSHSPLFALGMEQHFGSGGIEIVEMPSGHSIPAEAYSEFGKALDSYSGTKSFLEKVEQSVSQNTKPLVLVEGETDPRYLRKAATILEKPDLLEKFEIQWIGALNDNGQAFHTGKNGLNQTLATLQANPGFVNRKILLLYDNDTEKADQDFGSVLIRKLPTNDENKKVKNGIENLLSEDAFLPLDFKETRTDKGNGTTVVVTELQKVALCDRLLADGTKEQFLGFEPALALLEKALD